MAYSGKNKPDINSKKQRKGGKYTSMRNKKSNSAGFTLIELLIVIIIIGILAAIAFVAYSGSQTKAHQASAQSTVAEAKNKLAEYNADKGNYPADQATFDTWLASAEGGNNTTLSNDFTTTKGYTYTTTDSGYTISADHSAFKGSADITQTN